MSGIWLGMALLPLVKSGLPWVLVVGHARWWFGVSSEGVGSGVGPQSTDYDLGFGPVFDVKGLVAGIKSELRKRLNPFG